MLILGWFDSDRVLDIARNDTVLGVYFKGAGLVDIVVVASIDETLVPPLDIGRGFDEKSLLGTVIFYAGLSRLFRNLSST